MATEIVPKLSNVPLPGFNLGQTFIQARRVLLAKLVHLI